MKNLVNEINADMRANGDMWQIKRVNHEEMISISIEKLADLIVSLAFSPKLQAEIQEAQIAMNEEERFAQENMDKDEWFLPYFSKKDRVKEYMEIYDDFCKKELANVKDDEDIHF